MAYKAIKIGTRLAVFQKLDKGNEVIQGDWELEAGATIGIGEKYTDAEVLLFEGKPTVFLRAILLASTAIAIEQSTVFCIRPEQFFEGNHPSPGSASHLQRIFCNLLQLYVDKGVSVTQARRLAASGGERTVRYAGEDWTF